MLSPVSILLMVAGTVVLGQGTTAPANGNAAPASSAAPAAPASSTATAAPAASTAPASSTTKTAPAAPAEEEPAPFATDTTTTTSPAVETTPGQPIDPDKLQVSISFVKADLANVLAFLSLASNVPIVVDGDVKGTVTITSVSKVSLTTAYDVINSALRVHGYTMVGTLKDKVIRVEPVNIAKTDTQSIKYGPQAADIGSSDSIITVVTQLQYLNAAKLVTKIKAMVPDAQGSLIAEANTNSLILTDSEANVKRMLAIIKSLDQDTSSTLDVEVYQCQYANAASLITSIDQVFGITNTTSAQATPQQPTFGPGARGAQQNAANAALTANQGVVSLQGELHLASDDRTNSIMISASRPTITMVLNLVKKLDIDTTPDVNAKIFKLTYADATMVASQLNQIFLQPQSTSSNSNSGNPFMRMMAAAAQPATTANSAANAGLKQNMVVADLRTNSVIVTAAAEMMPIFQQVIQSLDTQNSLDNVARSFPLKFATATTMAVTLTQLFSGQGYTGANTTISTTANRMVATNSSSTYTGDPITSLLKITVVPDSVTNSLLITAPPQAFPMIQELINTLDKRPMEAYIEVAVVDVTLNDQDQFGLTWNIPIRRVRLRLMHRRVRRLLPLRLTPSSPPLARRPLYSQSRASGVAFPTR